MGRKEEEYHNYREKLEDLKERSNKIRMERERILSSKPWYSRPQNIIAVLAILIPITSTILFNFFQSEKKQLEIQYNIPQKLLDNNDQLKSSVSIQYDSLNINNISSIIVRISNTGDIPIKKSDFIDGPIRFNITDNFKKKNNDVFILDILKINDANQQNSEIELIESNGKGVFTYLPSLLNPNDEVIMNVLVSNEPTVNILISGKIEKGTINTYEITENKEGNIQVSSWGKSIISFFKNRAISIPITIFAFFVFFIFNIFPWAMLSNGEFESEPRILGPILIFSLNLLSVFTLILFIALII
ncbi:hypothetical protein [Maribacter sp. R77961]|uniref:hypothetical protein n=1 Tax=Maribacter sp. R77961 TaxID=3093871 RepID=UPI0037C8C537